MSPPPNPARKRCLLPLKSSGATDEHPTPKHRGGPSLLPPCSPELPAEFLQTRELFTAASNGMQETDDSELSLFQSAELMNHDANDGLPASSESSWLWVPVMTPARESHATSPRGGAHRTQSPGWASVTLAWEPTTVSSPSAPVLSLLLRPLRVRKGAGGEERERGEEREGREM